jgi:release factor glutamine methyltransferase
VVVSNPPYIARAERQSMLPTVYEFEPPLALFVEDNEPLLFYKAIAVKAASALKPGGLLALEINERFGKEVSALLLANQFENVRIIRDLFGKERIVTGRKLKMDAQ